MSDSEYRTTTGKGRFQKYCLDGLIIQKLLIFNLQAFMNLNPTICTYKIL